MSSQNRFGDHFLFGLCKVLGWLPYGVLYYGVVDVVYFFVYIVIGYRKSVVRENLYRSFPEKSNKELRRIERKFYRHLSELFIDTPVLCAISARKVKKRFRFVNCQEQEEQTTGQSWICAMAHYGSWEYTCAYKLFTDHAVAAVYRPLANTMVDRFYMRMRSRFGTRPVPMHNISRELLTARRNNSPMAVALIADQTPPRHEIHYWFDFLGRPTPFFMGTEKLALKFGIPVYFLHITKVKRGYYDARFVEIYDGKEPVGEYEVIERYTRELEKMIQEAPHLWLWSHKRWKHKPEPHETGA